MRLTMLNTPRITTARITTATSAMLAASALLAVTTLIAVGTAVATSASASDVKRFSDDAMLAEARRAAQSGQGSETVNIGRTPAEQRALEQRREAEINTLIARLKRAEAARSQRDAGSRPTISPPAISPQAISPWSTEVTEAPTTGIELPGFDTRTRSALGAEPTGTDRFGDDETTRGRVTILLVMNRDVARSRRSTDPILCLEFGCYISAGTQAPATFHNFNQAFGPFGRIGRGAGACNGSDVCAFRSVDLGLAGVTPIQPVTLRTRRADRSNLRDVVADDTCRMISGQLSCSRPVRTEAYTLWAVPERIASRIGPEALEAATRSGLETASAAELPWRIR